MGGLVVGAAGLRPTAILAQQKPKPVIGFLNGQSPNSWEPLVRAFRKGLGETGYVEGENVVIEYRWADGHYERLPALAAELVGRKVDVIVAAGGPKPAPAAKAATSTIPIVFSTGLDPVADGLVVTLARPGGNLTGFTVLNAALMEKRLELIAEMVPQAKTVALLVNPANQNSAGYMVDLPKVAQSKGLRIDIVKATTESEIDAAFASLGQLQSKALIAGSDAYFSNRRNQIIALAAQYRIPAIYDQPEYTSAGGLMTYGPSYAEVYRQVGVYTGKILRGAKPADLPVQQPQKFELIINLATAKTLGITVPNALLQRADEVIE